MGLIQRERLERLILQPMAREGDLFKASILQLKIRILEKMYTPDLAHVGVTNKKICNAFKMRVGFIGVLKEQPKHQCENFI